MKKIFLLFAAVTLIGFSSCDLTELPETATETDKALATFEGLDQASCVVYSGVRGNYGLSLSLYPDLMCGNCVTGDPIDTGGRGSFAHQWNFTVENGGMSVYASCYGSIMMCNNVIHKIKTQPEVYLAEEGVTQQDLDNLLAECYFVRAFMYYDLVRWYGQPYRVIKQHYDPSRPAAEQDLVPEVLGVPIVKEDINENVLDKPARRHVMENYEYIIADLKAALQLLDPNFTRAGVKDTKSMVSLGAINAVLSRVYLSIQDWANAEFYASEVINSGAYAIANANDYKTFWAEATWTNIREVVFGVYVDQQEGVMNGGPGSLTDPTNGYGDVRVSNDLLSIMDEDDVRYTMLRTTKDYADYKWPNKYQGKKGMTINHSSVAIIRISEVYLNRAEARLRQGLTDAAMRDVNMVRENRGVELFEAEDMTLANLFDERRRELAFEGHIFHDYKRWNADGQGKNLDRTDTNLPATSKDNDIDANDKRWTMPISRDEQNVNGNLQQTLGW